MNPVIKIILAIALLLTVFVAGLLPKLVKAAEEKTSPKIVFLISEDPQNNEATRTIPPFANELAKKYDCRCQVIQGEGRPNAFSFPGLKTIKDADLLVIFFRRRALPSGQFALIRSYLRSGKPLVGIRTANHVFSVHEEPAKGHEKWWEFVPEVFGCKNRGYSPATPAGDVEIVEIAANHPILKDIAPGNWHTNGCIYRVAPLIDKKATVLLRVKSENHVEPVAWTRQCNGSRVFYTSLGHPDDFDIPQFRTLLTNGIFWAMNRDKL